jgi:NodT family efflux transporter outer membrane factor (OMF) lipoprotein
MSFLQALVNEKIMLRVISFLSIFILVACKNQQSILKNTVSIPKTTDYQSEKLNVDSLTYQSTSKLPWKQFFGDPILQKLIDEALENNFDVRLAFQQLVNSQAGVLFMKGSRLPTLDVGVGLGTRKFGAYTVDGVGNYDTQFSTNLNDKQKIPDPFIPNLNIGLLTTWEVDLWGKILQRKKAAQQRFLSSEQGVNLVKTLLVSELAERYYSLIVLDRELEMLRENVELQENALRIVIAQKESGKSNELAFQLSTAQVLNTKAIAQMIEQEIIQIEASINQLLGRFPQAVERSKLSLEKELLQNLDVNTWQGAQWIENRPDVRQAMYQLNATNADLNAARLAFYPSLAVGGSIGFESFRASSFLNPASFAISALSGLTTPLLNRRELKAQLLSSKAQQRSAYLQYEKAINLTFNELAALKQQQLKLDELRNLKTEQVKVLNNAISTSKDLFSNGRAEYLEIITAQENFLRSQMDLLDAVFLQLQNKILYYRALGGGW